MIDADAIDHTLIQPFDQQAVRVVEHLRIFDAQTNQRIHIKETAVPQLAYRGLPIRDPEVLLVEQRVHAIHVLVQFFQALVDGGRDIGPLLA